MAKRRHARKSGKAPKKVRTENMPKGLAKKWKAINAGKAVDPRTGKRQVHKGYA